MLDSSVIGSSGRWRRLTTGCMRGPERLCLICLRSTGTWWCVLSMMLKFNLSLLPLAHAHSIQPLTKAVLGHRTPSGSRIPCLLCWPAHSSRCFPSPQPPGLQHIPWPSFLFFFSPPKGTILSLLSFQLLNWIFFILYLQNESAPLGRRGNKKFLNSVHSHLLNIGKTPVSDSMESITFWLISRGSGSPHWLKEHYIFETISLALKWSCLIDMTSILTIIYLIGSIRTAHSPKPLIQLIRPLSNVFSSWVCVDADQVAISPRIGTEVNNLLLNKVSDCSQIIQITLITDKS